MMSITALKLHNDAKTITLADELKDLYIGEQSPVAAPEVVADEATTDNNQMVLIV